MNSSSDESSLSPNVTTRAKTQLNKSKGKDNSTSRGTKNTNSSKAKTGDQKQKQQRNRQVQKIKGKQEESYEMFSKGYKTQVCEFYRKGNCHKGEDCKYRHDIQLQPLDQICKFFLVGGCHKQNCLYLHDTTKYPCRFLYISGKCDKFGECTFSHERFKNKEQVKEFIQHNLEIIRNHKKKGIMTPVIQYASENGFLKPTKEEEEAATLLVPPGMYSPVKGDAGMAEDENIAFGQIDPLEEEEQKFWAEQNRYKPDKEENFKSKEDSPKIEEEDNHSQDTANEDKPHRPNTRKRSSNKNLFMP